MYGKELYLRSPRYRLQREILRIPGLIGYWPLNEPSGATVIRNYAPATRGLLDGTPATTTIGQPGSKGRTCSFDGADSVITVPHNDVLNITNAITVGAIVNFAGYGEGNLGRIIDKGTNYIFNVDSNSSGRFRLTPDNGTTQYFSANGSLPSTDQNTWVFLLATYDRVNFNLYRNGVNVGTGASTQAFTANTDNLTIGNNAAVTRSFNGKLQHVFLIKGKAVTANEGVELARIGGFA